MKLSSQGFRQYYRHARSGDIGTFLVLDRNQRFNADKSYTTCTNTEDSQSKKRKSFNYIHYNPVKHEYTSSPYDWEESSVHWYRNNFGKEWLQDLWVEHPIKSYGNGWDEFYSVIADAITTNTKTYAQN